MAESAETPQSPPAAPAPAAASAPPVASGGYAGLAALMAADAPDTPRATAAPVPRGAPAAPPDPLAGLSREEKLASFTADPDWQEQARQFARREIDRREAAAREAQDREQAVQQQHQALLGQLEQTREYRQILADPFHERFTEAQQWTLQNTDANEQRLLEATVLANPQFQLRLGQYQEQVQQIAVQTAVEQGLAEAGLSEPQLEALRQSNDNNTIYKFMGAVYRQQGWVPPDVHKKELEAARQEGRRAGLGDWADERDYAPSLGAPRSGDRSDANLSGEAALRALFAADERANGGSRR